MANLTYNWQHGDNGNQEYYDTTVNGTYLLVFKNRWDSCWMCSVGDRIIHDRTRNDRQRKRQSLPKGCPVTELRRDAMLCASEPQKLMAKAEYCYRHKLEEISSS